MCKEDYVSFETAKLLKEKGFDWECISYYVDYEPNDVKYSFLGETNSTWESRCCSAPTLQMAMKWLREKHGIIILVSFFREDRFSYDILLDGECGDNYILHSGYMFEHFKNYEDACEVAIRYSLENLVINQ